MCAFQGRPRNTQIDIVQINHLPTLPDQMELFSGWTQDEDSEGTAARRRKATEASGAL